MEPISTGASVLAFVLLGLKSAKIIHGILTNESGTHVDQVRAGIQDLLSTLERLKRCRAATELQDQAFLAKIKCCVDHLTTFAATLQKLAVTDPGARFANQMKRLKAALNEKELIRMNDIITRDAGTLKLYLQALESDTVFEIRDTVRLGSSTLQVIQGSQSTLVAQQATLSASVRDSTAAVNDALHLGFQESALRSNEVMQKLVQFSDQSTTQSAEVTRSMDQVADLLANLKLLLEARPSVEEVRDDVQSDNSDRGKTQKSTSEGELPEYEKLLDSVRSVLGSIQGKRGIFSSNDREWITDGLVKFLQEMMSEKFLLSATTYQRWCDRCTQEDLQERRVTLLCLQGILQSSPRVAVNTQHGKEAAFPGALVRDGVKRRLYPTEIGDVSVVSLERKLAKRQKVSAQGLRHFMSSADEGEESDETTEVKSVISFLPGSGSPPTAWHLTTRQRREHLGTYNYIIHISVAKVLPLDSPVFGLIKEGKLTEFKEMLMLGETSLRDQDQFGTPLLFYANKQPEVCRFLLQHGADVDYIGPILDDDDGYIGTALRLNVNDNEAEPSELVCLLECRKLLLNAGCDPEIPVIDPDGDDEEMNNVFIWLEDGVPESIRLLLDNPFSMISTETVDRYGNTMLLAYCKSGRYHVDGLSLLLSRGANLNARDSAGNSCLHSCFSCAYGCYNLFNPRDRSGARCIRSSLALLLRNGADIHAVNCYGDTVSHLAYDYHFNNTSYPGDLWDAVLAECGHEISSHRKYQPRKPKYSDGYTRQKFEELWEGMEHLCPYYDDELLGEVSDDESSTDSNDEVCSHDGDDDEESSQDNGEEEWDCSSSYPSEEAGDSSGSDSDGGGGCLLG